MTPRHRPPAEVLILALPETAGSALYGMLDVLSAAGTLWQTLTRGEPGARLFRPRIVAQTAEPFSCGNDIPVHPSCAITDDLRADILVIPEIWLGPDEDIHGRYPALMEWLRVRHRGGTAIYSACSGTVLLAESGLLDGCEATSHWGYRELFATRYPRVRFRPEPNLVIADPAGRIVTAGGTTSWHDLALYIIARHGTPGEAMRIAKVYLLKWHDEGQLPYMPIVRRTPHADALVRRCEAWLREYAYDDRAVHRVIVRAGIPERTLKRRFKAATGSSLRDYVQNLRVEEAKRLLESSRMPVDEISAAVGYEDASFFRRLFKRLTGLSPGQYRRMFQPLASAEVGKRAGAA